MNNTLSSSNVIITFSAIVLLTFLYDAMAQSVNIPDPALRAAVEIELGKNPGDTITQAEMGAETFTFLFGDDMGISDLTGLEYATNLKIVFLQGNSISDITPLSNSTGLTNLYLTNNQISDISPLSNISAIHTLLLGYNEITSLENLLDLSSVHILQFQYNQITSIEPLVNHTELISEYETYVDLEGNPLDDESIKNHIPTLFFDRHIDVKFPSKYITKLSGDNQSSTTNAELQPFVVGVYDFDDNMLSGVNVKFEFFEGNGYFTNGSYDEGHAVSNTTTDADGRASATLTTGSESGTYRIRVTVPDARSKTFIATVIVAQTLPQLINQDQQDPIEQVSQQLQEQPIGESEIDTAQQDSSVDEAETNTSQQQQQPDTTQTPIPDEAETNTSQQQQQPDTTQTSIPDEQTKVLSKLSYPGQIGFSELMFTSKVGRDTLPQWIELYNCDDTEKVNLEGWKLEIETRDRIGDHQHVAILFEELHVLPKQMALIVTWSGRNSGNIPEDCIYIFSERFDGFEKTEYQNKILGQSGFSLKLLDPDGVVSDVAGNLDGDSSTEDIPGWDLPSGTTKDGIRTSLIRRYAKDTNKPLDGTELNNWRRSSELKLSIILYWGKMTDIGNPGYRGSRPLPVTLSYFRAEKTDTGVVIKWTTESEIDNAGFNILRGQTKQGPFVKVNTTLVQGAGTIGERNAYKWIDTSAKPNIEYYYRIEDVSFAGAHKVLATKPMKGIFYLKSSLHTQWNILKMRD